MNSLISAAGSMIDLSISVEKAKRQAARDMLVLRVGKILDKHYPGFAWWVAFEGGMIKVLNYSLSGDCGFLVSPDDLDVDGKTIMRYAGQLLELYKVARSAKTPDAKPGVSDMTAFSQLGIAPPKRVRQAHDLNTRILR